MHNIRGGILWSNNIKNLQHIIQNPIPLHSTVVVLILMDKALDLQERFFDGIEIGRIQWQELNANAKPIS